MERAHSWVRTTELRMEISLVVGHLGESVVNLIIQAHLLAGVDVLDGYARMLTERHLPVAVKCAAGIYAHRQRFTE